MPSNQFDAPRRCRGKALLDQDRLAALLLPPSVAQIPQGAVRLWPGLPGPRIFDWGELRPAGHPSRWTTPALASLDGLTTLQRTRSRSSLQAARQTRGPGSVPGQLLIDHVDN